MEFFISLFSLIAKVIGTLGFGLLCLMAIFYLLNTFNDFIDRM
jgi:hypothetical protein